MATRTRIDTVLVDGILLSSRSTTDVSRHEHDCDACIFMGHFEDNDLWFCPGDKSLISRYGPDGDYRSLTIEVYLKVKEAGMSSGDDPLRECLARLKDMDVY